MVGHKDGANYKPRPTADGWVRYPTVIERYYTTYTTSNHQCLHFHSNGLCVLAVSPTHPMLQPPNKVTAIQFRSHDSKNLMQTSVSGKRKAGAVFVLPRDMVCTVTVLGADGETSTVTLYGCVRANVIEVNHKLLTQPELLGTPSGYLAVLQPKLDEKKSLLENCKAFDSDTPFNVESTNSKRRAEGKPVRSTNGNGSNKRQKACKPCWSFAEKGFCKFGDKCRFLHEGAEAAVASSAAGDGAGEAAASSADAGAAPEGTAADPEPGPAGGAAAESVAAAADES